MSQERIKLLKDKFWAAETSLEEEAELQELVSREERPSSPEKLLFQYFDTIRKGSMPVKKLSNLGKGKFSLRFVLSIAASFLILCVAYFALFVPNDHQEGTIQDPEKALEVTLQAFALINEKMDVGEASIRENLKLFDKTLILKN